MLQTRSRSIFCRFFLIKNKKAGPAQKMMWVFILFILLVKNLLLWTDAIPKTDPISNTSAYMCILLFMECGFKIACFIWVDMLCHVIYYIFCFHFTTVSLLLLIIIIWFSLFWYIYFNFIQPYSYTNDTWYILG